MREMWGGISSSSPKMSPLCSPLGYSMDYPPSPPQPLAVPCAAATLKFRKADGGVLLLLWPPVPVQATLCWSHVGLGQPANRKAPLLAFIPQFPQSQSTDALYSQYSESMV